MENKLARIKGAEQTVLFPCGYSANIGLLSSVLTRKSDFIIHDAYCHASFYDGLSLANSKSKTYLHNDLSHLESILKRSKHTGDTYIATEGVFSMDGDIAPLDQLVELAQTYSAKLIVDDAHGTGVTGPQGFGSSSAFGLRNKIAFNWGTLSKTLAVSGAFIACDKSLADYLRYFARSYMFSTSIPVVSVAAALAGIDLITNDSSLHARLWSNINYFVGCLRQIDIATPNPQSAIIPLQVPDTETIRKAAIEFSKRGIFVNTVEYPAVPRNKQRFRVSLMASHTLSQIDQLVEAIDQIWDLYKIRELSATHLPS